MANRDKPLEYNTAVSPIMKYINSLPGAKVINIHGGIFTERGTPDVVGCINGQMVVFECKRSTDEEPTDIQKWRLCEWITAGAVVGAVSEVFHVKLILQLMGVI